MQRTSPINIQQLKRILHCFASSHTIGSSSILDPGHQISRSGLDQPAIAWCYSFLISRSRALSVVIRSHVGMLCWLLLLPVIYSIQKAACMDACYTSCCLVPRPLALSKIVGFSSPFLFLKKILQNELVFLS
jgi:hypothetical protein